MNLDKGHIGHCSSDHIYAAVNKATIVQQRPKSNKDLKRKSNIYILPGFMGITWTALPSPVATMPSIW